MAPKAILVGDIGSTKSTWWYGAEHPAKLQLVGYNPISHSENVRDEMCRQLQKSTEGISISRIWYYGAGVVDETAAYKIRSVLEEYYPGAGISVQSDLVGACIAACGSTKGTVAILGTGSHAAVWDGQQITRQANSLGYIIGDEGGGCDIGKSLVQAYYYNEMPEPIRTVMRERLPETRGMFLNALQAAEAPNQFLADFTKVAVQFMDHPWMEGLIASRFDLFIKRHLIPVQPEGEINVVGSIGCIFTGLISRLMANHNLSVGICIKDPALRLFERHHEHGK